MQGNNGPIERAVLEPRTTVRAPGSALHVLVNMNIKVIDSLLRHHDRLDVLRLGLVDHAKHVLGGVFGNREERAMADGSRRAEEHKVVGEVGNGQGQVALGTVFPLLREGDAVDTLDGVPRAERNVEAGSTDKDVDGDDFTSRQLDTFWHNFFDGVSGNVYIVLCQGLEVAVAGRGPPAANGKGWDEIRKEW